MIPDKVETMKNYIAKRLDLFYFQKHRYGIKVVEKAEPACKAKYFSREIKSI